MSKIQKAKELTKLIYQTANNNDFVKDLALGWQIKRASVSIMSNIAEGFERNKRDKFHQFLSTAKGSCAEVRSHLYIAPEAGYLTQSQFKELLSKAEEAGRIIGGLRVSVAKQRDTKVSKNLPQHSMLKAQH